MAKNKIIVQDSKGNKLVVQKAMIPQGFKYVEDYKDPDNDFSKFTANQLKKIKNDNLKAYLDGKGIEYNGEATKAELINLIVGD